MITPVGVLQENKEAALTAITELEKTIADSTVSIEAYREFIESVNDAIATLERVGTKLPPPQTIEAKAVEVNKPQKVKK